MQELLTFLPLILFLCTVGTVAGFMAGLLGIGGGLILVPAMYYGFQYLGYESDYLMHIAVGTSLAAILPTGFSSARAHYKRGAIMMDVLKKITPLTLCGSVFGVFLAYLITTPAVLMIIFGTAVLFVSLLMLIDTKKMQIWRGLPPPYILILLSFSIGALASLMGIGGALMSVPLLTMCGYAIHKAIGTASAIGLSISLPASLGFLLIGLTVSTGVPLTLGYIHVLALICITPFSIALAPWGAKVSHAMDAQKLRRVFVMFMIIMAVQMLYEAMSVSG
jgi:uncharacterized membrane protein YfcA